MIATCTLLLLIPPQLEAQTPQPTTIRQSLGAMDFGAVQATAPVPSPKPKRSAARSITGGVVGAIGGFIAGTYTAGLLMRDCQTCEPPPLPQGLMIGGPIGALAGSILGIKFL